MLVKCYYNRDHLGNVREVWKPSGDSALTVQRTRYYPSGLPWEYQAGDSASLQPYKYGGKEFVETHGLDMYDNHARWYYATIMRTITPDPMAEVYYGISPYAWCGNNPIRNVDPDGKIVVATTPDAKQTILNTLPPPIRHSINFDKNGNIDKTLFNEINSTSKNFASLYQLVNDETIYEVIISDEITYKNEFGELEVKNMGNIILSDDKNGSFGFSTGEEGWQGVTQTPGNEPNKYNSPDNTVKIVLNSNLSTEGKAQTFSHEGYGHAYLYSKGVEHKHQPQGLKETNQALSEAIRNAIEETIKNMGGN